MLRWRSVALAVLLMVTVTSCLHRNIAIFTPVPGQPHLSPAEVRARAEALMRIECPRVLSSSPRTWGTATLLAFLDPDGNVREAELEQGTGDGRIDDLLGGLSASMRWIGAKPPARARVHIGYSCSPTTGISTIRVERAT